MNKVISGLMATAIAASFALASAVPVAAAVYFPMPPKSDPVIENVAYRGYVHRPVHVHPNVRYHPNVHYHPNVRYHPNAHIHPVARGAYYNGYHGYRDYRPGYRHYNGWWYPAGAFVGGAIVGSAIASQPTYVEPSGNAHVQWCYNRYRSYRASDNTFQPNSGPRQQCRSPY